ncbi:MAG: T9SS type A sorting domain-containing protein [Ignavibacteria bacterium]|nr:T9SS type A sorting domain-containing protein [Ignavibacteria bacterium]
MKRFWIILVLFASTLLNNDLLADNTAGSMLHVDPAKFNHPNLIQLTWKAEIYEYEYVPLSPYTFRIRIEFNSVGFMGRGTSYPYCWVGVMVQNLGHSFNDNVVGTQFGSNPTITNFPAVGLYISSLQSTWSDSSHGLKLLANPTAYPKIGRVFENIDNLGYSGKNIYTRQNIGSPSPSAPITVRWTVTKKGTVVNPPDSLSRNLSGNWIPLRGTFVIWNFKIEINGVTFDVVDYYLPIEKAEYILAWDPLTLHQEYFGAKERILHSQKGTVRYVDIRASDGTKWYNLEDWKITWRIDDAGGNLENRFGWKSDGQTLTSRVGHDDDSTLCSRDIGQSFKLALPVTSVENDNRYLLHDFELQQNYPNPFNPSTVIRFSIPTVGFVCLTVYNVLGLQVAVLINQVKSPGAYTATLDATELSSGVYFYRLRVGSFTETKRLVLLK